MLQRNAGGFGGAGTAPPIFLFVLCHGYGSNASQMAPLAEALAFPQAASFVPDAPAACPLTLHDVLHASRRRQWFPLERPLPDRSPEAQEAAARLNREVDAELERLGLAEDAVFFVGFSQGAMVSLLASLSRPVAPRGIVAIAGALLAPEGPLVPASQPPVLLVHGAADSVVPPARSEDAARRLRAAGIEARLMILPGLDHVILDEATPYACAFIAEALR